MLRTMLRELNLDPAEADGSSIRKCATAHVERNGVSKEDQDARGRLKPSGAGCISAVDAKVASVLCIGGACAYVLKEDAVPSQFVLDHVVPQIFSCFGGQVGLVLGNALLWCCFSDDLSNIVPLFIREE
jgi:hypothetical protein